MGTYTISAPTATTPATQTSIVDSADYPVRRFVELTACVALLELRYFEMVDEAGLSRRAGDWSYERSASVLEELKEAIKYFKGELNVWAKNIGALGNPVTGVFAGSWNWEGEFDDLSYVGYRRPTLAK